MQTSPQRLQATEEGPPPVFRSLLTPPANKSNHAPKRPHILVCVDDSPRADAVANYALAIARSLGLEVTFARVIEQPYHPAHPAMPADPIEWQLHLERQRALLDALDQGHHGCTQTSGVLLVGDAPQELIAWGEAHGASLLALSTAAAGDPYAMGSTALRVLQRGATSLLLVPPKGGAVEPKYRRIMVPIDGSARAESVLPIARRIARTHGAQLVLVHVLPKTGTSDGFTQRAIGPLKDQIERQNYRNAKSHLDLLSARIEEDGLDVQVRLLGPADPRQAACKLASDLSVDLIVMSSHGVTALNDVPCGSVAEYLATHSSMPVLMLRPNLVTDFGAGVFDKNGQSAFSFG